MSSEDQVALGVKNSVKIEMGEVENDESKTVNNDTPFEIPLPEVRFLTKLTYKVQIPISFTNTVMRPTTGPADTGAGKI